MTHRPCDGSLYDRWGKVRRPVPVQPQQGERRGARWRAVLEPRPLRPRRLPWLSVSELATGQLTGPTGWRAFARIRAVQALLGLLSLAFVVLLMLANPGCSGFPRNTLVNTWVLLSLIVAASLAWAVSRDDEPNRFGGSLAAGALTGIWLSTLSLPILVVPLSVVGCFRLPHARAARVALAVLIPILLVACTALPSVVLRLWPATSCG